MDDRVAYWWSLAALLGLAGVALWRPADARGNAWILQLKITASQGSAAELFAYSSGLLTALSVGLIFIATVAARGLGEASSAGFHNGDFEIALWSLTSHCAVAVVVLSALNFIRLAARSTSNPRAVRRILTGALIVAALWTALSHFLNNALSFDGWGARTYAGSMALALTLWGFSLVQPFLDRQDVAGLPYLRQTVSRKTVLTYLGMAILIAMALTSHWLIGGEDWNGVVENTSALVLWVGLSLCVYRLRPARASYSAALVLAVLMGGALTYKALQATEIFWGKAMGSTDDEISLKLEDYGSRDASFRLAHHVLGNGRTQSCGDFLPDFARVHKRPR